MIEILGTNVEYFEADQRPDKSKGNVLIFIHGAGSNCRLWEPQIEFLKEKNRVLAISLPGHAESDEMNLAISINNYVLVMLQFMEKVCPGTKPVLIGHSMGSAIAQQIALEHAGMIKGIVLIGSGAKLRVMKMIFEFLTTNYEEFIKMGPSIAFSKKTKDKELIRKSEDIARMTQASVTKADFQVCDTFDLMKKIEKLSLPTLILTGAEDKLTPVKYAEFLKSHIKNSELHIIPDAGHLVSMEKSKEVNELIEKFVENL